MKLGIEVIEKFVQRTGLKVVLGDGYIACYGDETVYLNKHLIKQPNLLQMVLDHEEEHFKDEEHENNWFDELKNILKTDSKDLMNKAKHLNLLGFNFMHPDSMIPLFVYINKEGKKKSILVFNQLVLMFALTLLLLFILSMLM